MTDEYIHTGYGMFPKPDEYLKRAMIWVRWYRDEIARSDRPEHLKAINAFIEEVG
jgi:hypothetical protein